MTQNWLKQVFSVALRAAVAVLQNSTAHVAYGASTESLILISKDSKGP